MLSYHIWSVNCCGNTDIRALSALFYTLNSALSYPLRANLMGRTELPTSICHIRVFLCSVVYHDLIHRKNRILIWGSVCSLIMSFTVGYSCYTIVRDIRNRRKVNSISHNLSSVCVFGGKSGHDINRVIAKYTWNPGNLVKLLCLGWRHSLWIQILQPYLFICHFIV